jgi:cytoskeletal protein CcmA (bactofilin family)
LPNRSGFAAAVPAKIKSRKRIINKNNSSPGYSWRLMPRSEQTEMSPTISRDLVPDARSQATSPKTTLSGEHASIGKSVIIRGEVSGFQSLYIEGKIEGTINFPDKRVTIGRNGEVVADILAGEIVVLGNVRGNCQATGHVEIRSEGSITGDVIAGRISIEDGASFKGGVDLRNPGTSDVQSHESQKHVIAVEGSPFAAHYDAQAEDEISQGKYQTLDDDSDLEELIPRWRSTAPVQTPSVKG